MPMTQLPKIGAENRYQKTGTEFFLYQFLVTNRTMALFSYRLMVLVF